MKANLITSIILSRFLGCAVPIQPSLVSGMSPLLGYIVNRTLVVFMLVIVVLYLFQKVKKHK